MRKELFVCVIIVFIHLCIYACFSDQTLAATMVEVRALQKLRSRWCVLRPAAT